MAQMLAPISLNSFAAPAAPGDFSPKLDATQNINPWSWMTSFAHNQFSLFTVNLGTSAAPQVEAAILENIGSYGRQLGRIGDVIEVLVKRLPRDALTADELAAVEDFNSQQRAIRKIKAG